MTRGISKIVQALRRHVKALAVDIGIPWHPDPGHQ